MAEIQRDGGLRALIESYDEWLLELPHIYDRGDGRAQCDALKALDPVARDLRVLIHCLMRHGEAPLGSRLETAFGAVKTAAASICEFFTSRKFNDTEWLYGDTLAQGELVVMHDESVDLVERAAEILASPLEDGWTLPSLRLHAAFWLAYNLACHGAEPAEARNAIVQLLSRSRLKFGPKMRITRAAMWRAYGKLALGYEYLEGRIGPKKLAALGTFAEELCLARTVAAPANSESPQIHGFVRLEDIRKYYPQLTDKQIDLLRKHLEAWRKTHEDFVLMTEENPDTGRRRYAYPGEIVMLKVADISGGR